VTVATVLALGVSAQDAAAQGRGRATTQVSTPIGDISLTIDMQSEIRTYYESRGPTGAEALPPGSRRNLARGRPLPPGIAKKAPPPELQARVPVAPGYELVEVRLHVVLVEVATALVHDVLTDVIR
jgi:hypothetical protein